MGAASLDLQSQASSVRLEDRAMDVAAATEQEVKFLPLFDMEEISAEESWPPGVDGVPLLRELLPDAPETAEAQTAGLLRDEALLVVARIAAAEQDNVLLGTNDAERAHCFWRAVLLIHPSRGHVSSDDRHVSVALNRLLKAWKPAA